MKRVAEPSLAAGASAGGPSKKQRAGIQEYADRKLSRDTCKKIDIAFAMAIFTMALSLNDAPDL